MENTIETVKTKTSLTFGEEYKIIRLRHNLSQTQIAQKIGLSQVTGSRISELERGSDYCKSLEYAHLLLSAFATDPQVVANHARLIELARAEFETRKHCSRITAKIDWETGQPIEINKSGKIKCDTCRQWIDESNYRFRHKKRNISCNRCCDKANSSNQGRNRKRNVKICHVPGCGETSVENKYKGKSWCHSCFMAEMNPPTIDDFIYKSSNLAIIGESPRGNR